MSIFTDSVTATQVPPMIDAIMEVAPAAIVAAPPVLAALSPPSIPMFPPQGGVQPGALAQGGGALPANVVMVRKFE